MDVPELLLQMRHEQREDHERLVARVDAGFARVTTTLTAHELEDERRFGTVDTRLVIVENTRRTARWFLGAAITAFVASVADFISRHLK